MLLAQVLISTIALVSTASANPAVPHQHSKRACSSRVDISKKVLPFLDYPAIQQAADDAIAEVERNQRVNAGLEHPEANLKHKRALTCPNGIRVKKNWKKLTTEEKKGYIVAEKCLMKLGNLGLAPTGATYYDAFTHIHQQDWMRFHGNANFLPWHRWFVWLHAESLRGLCNYTGTIPYWDYVEDSADVFKSELFSKDPEVGFGDGGSVPIQEIPGVLRAFKVDNGAFAEWRPFFPVPHFLTRNFTPSSQYNPGNRYGIGLSQFYNQAAVARAMNATNFWAFETIIDGLDESQNRGIHNAPHFMNGGDGIGPGYVQGTRYFPAQSPAPNDPLFFMTHGNVDYIWWKWQQRSAANQYDFRAGGGGGGGGFPGGGGSAARGNICDKLPYTSMGPDPPAGLVLKTEWYPQCYTYEA